MCTMSLSREQSSWGVALTKHTPSSAKVKNEWSLHLRPLYVCLACYGKTVSFYFCISFRISWIKMFWQHSNRSSWPKTIISAQQTVTTSQRLSWRSPARILSLRTRENKRIVSQRMVDLLHPHSSKFIINPCHL